MENTWEYGRRNSESIKHISNPVFGTGDELSLFFTLLEEAYIDKDTNKGLLLNRLYDTAFGIYDHSKGLAPTAVYGTHDAESIKGYSAKMANMRRYASSRINELFGISYEEYLDLDFPTAQKLHITSTEITEEEVELQAINDKVKEKK